MAIVFEDRTDAGRWLARRVHSVDRPVVVLGIPRGGVVVAAEVARSLQAPLDVLVVRKLGHPRRRELGVGALGEDGVRVLNDALVTRLGLDADEAAEELADVEREEAGELARRVDAYRQGRPPRDLTGCTALVVDDGLATGYTALAAVEVARRRGAARVVVAVPVGSREALALLRSRADEVVCLVEPRRLRAVGHSYADFGEVEDEAVIATLQGSSRPT
jgi:putative phosphoribosyl transferase